MGVPGSLKALVEACWSQDPKARPGVTSVFKIFDAAVKKQLAAAEAPTHAEAAAAAAASSPSKVCGHAHASHKRVLFLRGGIRACFEAAFAFGCVAP